VDAQGFGRLLIVVGLVVVLLGGVLALGGRLGLGHLPGDIVFRRGRVRVYLPIATSILVSVVLTLVLNALLRR